MLNLKTESMIFVIKEKVWLTESRSFHILTHNSLLVMWLLLGKANLVEITLIL